MCGFSLVRLAAVNAWGSLPYGRLKALSAPVAGEHDQRDDHHDLDRRRTTAGQELPEGQGARRRRPCPLLLATFTGRPDPAAPAPRDPLPLAPARAARARGP